MKQTDQQVAYVMEALITFRRQSHKQGTIERCMEAERLASEIVQHVTSYKAPVWKRLFLGGQ